jgi:fructose-bisphosphate aldolase class II
MLVHIKEIIQKAEEGGYAVGAFNTFNLETTQAILRTAEENKSPVIIQISEKTIKYASVKVIAEIMKSVAEVEAPNVPVAMHIDHGKSMENIKAVIENGFTSVHFDGSEFEYEENIVKTKEAAEYAHEKGCFVQGELGTIVGAKNINQNELEDLSELMTKPEEAQEFVERTEIDTFAPSVGAMHGMFKGGEKIDQERLKKIRESVKIPFVLHGASGVAKEDIKEAIQNGVRVVNIDTRLRKEFTFALRETLAQDIEEIDARKFLVPSIEAMQKAIKEKMDLFGSTNKA